MKNVSITELVSELRAAGETTRLRVLLVLSHGELSVGELAQVLGQSQPRLSRHLKLLNGAGLIDRMPEGAWVFYRLPTTGWGRELVDILTSSIDPEDPEYARDRQRLEEVKAERSEIAQEYFSRVADNWDALRALHYADAKIETAILSAAGKGPFERVLDFGTGTGRMLILLADRAERVEGIDLSHQMLTVARSNLKNAGVENALVQQGDATASPFEAASADLVIIHQVLHFLDDPGRALNEAARVLKPGGRLIVVDFAKHDLEHLRDEHAHRHLGISGADLAQWADAFGLSVRDSKTFDPPAGKDGVAVSLWVADRAQPHAESRPEVSKGDPVRQRVIP